MIPTPQDTDPALTKNVINLSSIQFTENTIKLLEKGLSFIPTPQTVKASEYDEALKELSRDLAIKDFFKFIPPPPRHNPTPQQTFKNRSNWKPEDILTSTRNTIDDLTDIYNLMTLGLDTKQTKNQMDTLYLLKHKQNLTNTDMHELHTLRKNPNIIIKPADKGGNIVIMDTKNYIKECEKQLNDPEYYTRIETPIWPENKKNIENILQKLLKTHYITNPQHLFLKPPDHPRDRLFYILPKIHKPLEKWMDPHTPPGRPIISDCGSESYLISRFLDFYLKPLSTRHPSYIKDTYDFLNKIKHLPIPNKAFLVTFDVNSLYTNMNLNRTIAVVQQYLKLYPEESRPDQYLIELLKISIKNNDFTFNGNTYLQTKGVAMGKSFAPTLANLYLLDFDAHILRGNGKYNVHHYYRFLDDGFLIWPHTIEELIEFETYLNKITPGITIKFEYNPNFINYLDVTIYKVHLKNHALLATRTYFKPTTTLALLHKDSFHPKHTFQGVLKSQLIRYKRISSTFHDYEITAAKLFQSLQMRGYHLKNLMNTKRTIWNGPEIWIETLTKNLDLKSLKEDLKQEDSLIQVTLPDQSETLTFRTSEIIAHIEKALFLGAIHSTIPLPTRYLGHNQKITPTPSDHTPINIILPHNHISRQLGKEWGDRINRNPKFQLFRPRTVYKNPPNLKKLLVHTKLTTLEPGKT